MTRLRAASCAVGVWAALLHSVVAYDRPDRFMFASSPDSHNVYWVALPTFHELTMPREARPVRSAQLLIDGDASRCSGWSCNEGSDKGLITPSGLALWQPGTGPGKLFVSDLDAGCIYRYKVDMHPWYGIPRAGNQDTMLCGLKGQGKWLAVDGYGNLFYPMSQDNTIQMITYDMMRKFNTGEVKPRTLYSSRSRTIASPAGIAADNFNIYWANSQGDENTGSLVAANAVTEKAPKVLVGKGEQFQVPAENICLARKTLYFSGDRKSLYAVKVNGTANVTNGSATIEISHSFKKPPKGCVYDQESTVYVAHEDTILSLPAISNLRPISKLDKVAEINKPDQLVIFFGPSSLYQLRALSQAASGAVRGTGLLALILALAASVQ